MNKYRWHVVRENGEACAGWGYDATCMEECLAYLRDAYPDAVTIQCEQEPDDWNGEADGDFGVDI